LPRRALRKIRQTTLVIDLSRQRGTGLARCPPRSALESYWRLVHDPDSEQLRTGLSSYFDDVQHFGVDPLGCTLNPKPTVRNDEPPPASATEGTGPPAGAPLRHASPILAVGRYQEYPL
jgi:hypothetical protein